MGEAFLSVVETTLHGFEIVFLNEPELSFVIAHKAFPITETRPFKNVDRENANK